MGLRESGPRKKEEPNALTRRAFLRGGLSAGAVAAMPNAAWALTTEQSILREKEDAEYFERLIKDPIAQKLFRESPTQKEVGAVIRSLARTNELWVNAFESHKELMHEGARILNSPSEKFVGNGTVLEIATTGKDGKNAYRYVIVTAAHVADRVEPPEGREWTYHPKGIDVAVCEISDAEAVNPKTGRIDALPLMPLSKQGEDISGQVGLVLARKDKGDSYERKFYPSRVSPKISDKVLRKANVPTTENFPYLQRAHRASWRMTVLPPGEARKGEGEEMSTNRTSGSAFLCVPPGSQEVTLGGIHVAATETSVEGMTYSLGAVVDHMYVRETIAEYFKKSGIKISSALVN